MRGMFRPQRSHTRLLLSVSRKIPLGKVAGVVLLFVLIGVFVWQSSAIVGFFQSFSGSGDSEYSTLSLVAGQYVTYESGNRTFVFSYKLSAADQTDLFYVVDDLQQTRSFPAAAGAVYHEFGLEIKVSVVNSDLAVLLVKPS